MNAKSQKKEWDEMNSSASFCILLPLRGRAEQRNTHKEFPMSLLKIMPKAKGKNGMMDGWMDG
jgi:hypothetical protein